MPFDPELPLPPELEPELLLPDENPLFPQLLPLPLLLPEPELPLLLLEPELLLLPPEPELPLDELELSLPDE